MGHILQLLTYLVNPLSGMTLGFPLDPLTHDICSGSGAIKPPDIPNVKLFIHPVPKLPYGVSIYARMGSLYMRYPLRIYIHMRVQLSTGYQQAL